jgi:hypothetical protein
LGIQTPYTLIQIIVSQLVHNLPSPLILDLAIKISMVMAMVITGGSQPIVINANTDGFECHPAGKTVKAQWGHNMIQQW